MCCVLTVSLETSHRTEIITSAISLSRRNSRQQRHTGSHYGMNIQVLHSAQQNAAWSWRRFSTLNVFSLLNRSIFQFHVTPSFLALSLHVEGKMAFKRYDITREHTGLSLPTDKSTSLSTHGSHSDTQSSPQGLIWNDKLAILFSIIVLSTTQEHWKHLESPPES